MGEHQGDETAEHRRWLRQRNRQIVVVHAANSGGLGLQPEYLGLGVEAERDRRAAAGKIGMRTTRGKERRFVRSVVKILSRQIWKLVIGPGRIAAVAELADRPSGV